MFEASEMEEKLFSYMDECSLRLIHFDTQVLFRAPQKNAFLQGWALQLSIVQEKLLSFFGHLKIVYNVLKTF